MSVTLLHVRYVSVTSVTQHLPPSLHYYTSVTFVTRSDLTKPYAWNETHCQVNSTGLTLLRQYFSAPARRLALLETLNRASLPSDRLALAGSDNIETSDSWEAMV